MSYDEHDENVRRCPTCRSMISVMATRCKHCGERVSRPRTEEERFTVQDLGGVSAETYRMSESVIGALEAFREDELNSPNPGDTFHTPTFGGHARDALTLDEAHKALAQAAAADPQEVARRKQLVYARNRNSNDSLRNTGMILGGLVLALALVFGGIKLMHHFSPGPENLPPPRVNYALQWLSSSQYTTLEALEEAARAIQHSNSPENQQIADTVRDRVEAEVRTLLYGVPYNRSDMSEASAIATRASAIDAHRRMANLRDEAQREVSAYKFSLTNINPADGSATFKISNPYFEGPREQVIQKGDYLAGRFLVNAVRTDQVELTDDEVKNSAGAFRQIRIRVLEPIRAL